MNLSIVAEGVETIEQSDYLKSNGCDKIQGYFFSKPLCPQDLELWINESS
jgi:EAL domain-containing protein (putative c-di-GMP-specific phosphodiesterase class I)